jgi:hypothetical protein
MPTSMVVGHVDQRLDVPLHFQLAHQAVQDPGQQQDLERQRQAGRPVEVRLPRGDGDDQGGQAQHQALQGEQVDQRQHAPLRQHGEGEQQDHRGEQVDQLRGQRNRVGSYPALQQQPHQQAEHGEAGRRCRGTPARGRCASWR